MKLYDKKFVYFDWNDNLKGKKGFFADNINNLKQHVKDNNISWFGKIFKNSSLDDDDVEYPFETIDDSGWHRNFRFCYYDPYYEFRRAYLEGKQLQFKDYAGNWKDVVGEPIFTRDEYHIKPETTWYIVLNDCGLSRCNSKKDDVMFEGTEEECIKWMDKYGKFEKIMLACRQGKTIQYKDGDEWTDWMLNDFPRNGAFDTWKKWRIKDEVESVPFDSVQELIDVWEKKSGVKFNHELAMPFIWIKNKYKNRVYLITDFLFDKYFADDVGTEDSNLQLKELFEDYTFLDNSIIGKVKEIKENENI